MAKNRLLRGALNGSERDSQYRFSRTENSARPLPPQSLAGPDRLNIIVEYAKERILRMFITFSTVTRLHVIRSVVTSSPADTVRPSKVSGHAYCK